MSMNRHEKISKNSYFMRNQLFLVFILAVSNQIIFASSKCRSSEKRVSVRQATGLTFATALVSIMGTIYLTEKCVSDVELKSVDMPASSEGLARGPIRSWREGKRSVTIGPDCKPSRKCLDYVASGELPDTDWLGGGYKIPTCFAPIDYTHSCYSVGYFHGKEVRGCYSLVCEQPKGTGVIKNAIFFVGDDALGSNNPCHPGMDAEKSAVGQHIFHCPERTTKRSPNVASSYILHGTAKAHSKNSKKLRSNNNTLPKKFKKDHR